ncbi:helix-turn-helix domain-containing protein [Streptomyces sp. NPDC002677]|uniref:helix-turn-helix domain-containing protein n=1 Tax=Streptomyces sp. NPDC002677 TaxID=3154774 RepID=UPI003332B639
MPDIEAPWSARLEWQQSTVYGLALCAGGREVVQRETRHIRSDPRRTYELLVPLAGKAWVEQGPSATEIRPGSMVLCDIDRPMRFAHDADFLLIAQIAYSCGFASHASFATTFRSEFGMTPSTARRGTA